MKINKNGSREDDEAALKKGEIVVVGFVLTIIMTCWIAGRKKKRSE